MVDYYVRLGKQIIGPVSGNELNQLIADGRITAMHLISSDKRNWTPANQAKGLTLPGPEASRPQTPRKTRDETAEWYLHRDDRTVGPVTYTKMIKNIEEGRIRAEDIVWKEDNADLSPIGGHPDFAHMFPMNHQSTQTKGTMDEVIYEFEDECPTAPGGSASQLPKGLGWRIVGAGAIIFGLVAWSQGRPPREFLTAFIVGGKLLSTGSVIG